MASHLRFPYRDIWCVLITFDCAPCDRESPEAIKFSLGVFCSAISGRGFLASVIPARTTISAILNLMVSIHYLGMIILNVGVLIPNLMCWCLLYDHSSGPKGEAREAEIHLNFKFCGAHKIQLSKHGYTELTGYHPIFHPIWHLLIFCFSVF